MSSNIAAIVDYSAQRAALFAQHVWLPNGTEAGVRSVFGSGQGIYSDPLRPGEMIQAAGEKPLEPFMHVSDLPDAPTIDYITQEALVSLTWMVPMRLYTARGNLRNVRETLLPFYDAYLAAFIPDWTLGGLCMNATLASFKVEADDDWAWLAMELRVTEQVSY